RSAFRPGDGAIPGVPETPGPATGLGKPRDAGEVLHDYRGRGTEPEKRRERESAVRILAEPRRQVGNRSHPLQFALDVLVKGVLFAYGLDLLAADIDFGQVELADAEVGTEPEIAHPVRVDAHGFDAYAVGGNVVRGGNGHAGLDRGTGTGSVALHAFEPVDYGSAPERLHRAGGEEHVEVGLADAVVVFTLVVPARCFARRLVQGGAQPHVFHR